MIDRLPSMFLQTTTSIVLSLLWSVSCLSVQRIIFWKYTPTQRNRMPITASRRNVWMIFSIFHHSLIQCFVSVFLILCRESLLRKITRAHWNVKLDAWPPSFFCRESFVVFTQGVLHLIFPAPPRRLQQGALQRELHEEDNGSEEDGNGDHDERGQCVLHPHWLEFAWADACTQPCTVGQFVMVLRWACLRYHVCTGRHKS